MEYDIGVRLVGSEMCIRYSYSSRPSIVLRGRSYDPVNGCRTRRALHRMFLQHLHRLRDAALELRVVAAHELRGGILDLDVRCDTLVLDRPSASAVVEGEIRSGDAACVDHIRNAERADEPSPRARADQWAELRDAEVVRERVASGAGRLVDDHHLRTEYAGHRRRDCLSCALREVAHARAAELLNDVVLSLIHISEP